MPRRAGDVDLQGLAAAADDLRQLGAVVTAALVQTWGRRASCRVVARGGGPPSINGFTCSSTTPASSISAPFEKTEPGRLSTLLRVNLSGSRLRLPGFLPMLRSSRGAQVLSRQFVPWLGIRASRRMPLQRSGPSVFPSAAAPSSPPRTRLGDAVVSAVRPHPSHLLS